MKRTEPTLCPLDLVIWFAIDRHDIFRLAREVDRTDADLMLYAQQHKARMGCYVGQSWVQYRGKYFV